MLETALLSWIVFLPIAIVGGLLGVEGALRLFFSTRLTVEDQRRSLHVGAYLGHIVAGYGLERQPGPIAALLLYLLALLPELAGKMRVAG